MRVLSLLALLILVPFADAFPRGGFGGGFQFSAQVNANFNRGFRSQPFYFNQFRSQPFFFAPSSYGYGYGGGYDFGGFGGFQQEFTIQRNFRLIQPQPFLVDDGFSILPGFRQYCR